MLTTGQYSMDTTDPLFAQYPEHDAVVSAWMAAQGWPVTLRVYDYERDVFAWRHGTGSGARTLRVTQAAVDDTPPTALRAFLDGAGAAALIQRDAAAHLVLGVDAATGAVRLGVPDAPPG